AGAGARRPGRDRRAAAGRGAGGRRDPLHVQRRLRRLRRQADRRAGGAVRGPRASLSSAPARAAPSTPRARLARAAWIALALAGCATPDPGPNRDRVVLHATEVTPLLGEVELRC